MVSEIYSRRSIRKYKSKMIPRQDIVDIIESGTKAPSSKNRQPWKYIVLQGKKKHEMLNVFRAGIAREETGSALLPQSRKYIDGARHTVEILEQAPVVVFAVNPFGKGLISGLTPEERIYDKCNIQSIGASIQNMLLAAQEKGIGSLWVCDIYFAYPELCEWLNAGSELLAAVAFGYPDESPEGRPRKKLDDTIEWKE